MVSKLIFLNLIISFFVQNVVATPGRNIQGFYDLIIFYYSKQLGNENILPNFNEDHRKNYMIEFNEEGDITGAKLPFRFLNGKLVYDASEYHRGQKDVKEIKLMLANINLDNRLSNQLIKGFSDPKYWFGVDLDILDKGNIKNKQDQKPKGYYRGDSEKGDGFFKAYESIYYYFDGDEILKGALQAWSLKTSKVRTLYLNYDYGEKFKAVKDIEKYITDKDETGKKMSNVQIENYIIKDHKILDNPDDINKFCDRKFDDVYNKYRKIYYNHLTPRNYAYFHGYIGEKLNRYKASTTMLIDKGEIKDKVNLCRT